MNKSIPKIRDRLPQTAQTNVSLDSRYNSQTIDGTYKQGTYALQAVGLAIECQTDSRDIIGVYTENKLLDRRFTSQ